MALTKNSRFIQKAQTVGFFLSYQTKVPISPSLTSYKQNILTPFKMGTSDGKERLSFEKSINCMLLSCHAHIAE